MTFVERYNQCDSWWQKVIVMNLYHTYALSQHKNWTLTNTASIFEVSIGLVSENLKLAKAIHENGKLTECNSRAEALERIK